MPKVIFDTDKIKNNMNPLIQTEKNSLSSAIQAAGMVTFPKGEFDWGNISSDLQECLREINVYSNWLNNIKDAMSNTVVDYIETFESLEISDVKKKEIA